MSEQSTRRVVRSKGGRYDYIMEGVETVCTMRVPLTETPEYSRRVAEIIAAPELLAALADIVEWQEQSDVADAPIFVAARGAIAKARGEA